MNPKHNKIELHKFFLTRLWAANSRPYALRTRLFWFAKYAAFNASHPLTAKFMTPNLPPRGLKTVTTSPLYRYIMGSMDMD